MFLSLELPGGDKGVSIFCRDLAGDQDFDPMDSWSTEWDSDHSRADRAIQGANRKLGKEPFKAFHSLFHQFNWKGTTGWEYWSGDYGLMLKHALLVAAALGVPLNVHTNVIDEVMSAASAANISFDFDLTPPVENPNDRDFRHIKTDDYFVLTGVSLPADMPSAPEL